MSSSAPPFARSAVVVDNDVADVVIVAVIVEVIVDSSDVVVVVAVVAHQVRCCFPCHAMLIHALVGFVHVKEANENQGTHKKGDARRR